MMRPLVVAMFFVSASALGNEAAGAKSEVFKTAFVEVSQPWLSAKLRRWATADSGASPVRPRINLNVWSWSERDFWVEARLIPPAPHSHQTQSALLRPRESIKLEYAYDVILAETDYKLDVTVSSDSAFTDTLEHNSGQFRFDAEAVHAIDEKVARKKKEFESREREAAKVAEAKHLPRTYEGLMFFDGKLGLFSGKAGTPRGTLIVNPDSLIFRSNQRTVAIAGAQLREVEVRTESGKNCVAVEYDEGGATKQARIMAGLVGGYEKLPLIETSLKAMKARDETPREEPAHRPTPKRIPISTPADSMSSGEIYWMSGDELVLVEQELPEIGLSGPGLLSSESKLWIDVEGPSSRRRISEARPHFRVAAEEAEVRALRLGVLKIKEGNRRVYLDTSENDFFKDKVPLVAQRIQDGLYDLSPKKPLEAGEYAIGVPYRQRDNPSILLVLVGAFTIQAPEPAK